MLNKHPMKIFFAVVMLQTMAANLVHPVTPTIIKNLQLPDSMFGLAFATMAFTNFLFSPFWGKLKEYCSAGLMLLICCSGYALGQIFFCISRTEGTILFARCFSGIFLGGINVAILVFLLEITPKEKTGENLARLAILQALGLALGYLTGGVLGVLSITGTFILQASTLILSGVLFSFITKIKPAAARPPLHIKTILKDANPLSAFLSCRIFMTKRYLLLFAMILFAFLGSNAFDQSFNYYIKDQFGFTSAYNGLIKAVVGIVTLASNSTICMWLLRHKDVKKASFLTLFSSAVCVLLLLPVGALTPFLAICILFYAVSSIAVPLMQDSIAKKSGKHGSLVMSFYNAMRSLGMIGGALVAGEIYAFGPKLPFAFSCICFACACVFACMAVLYKPKPDHVKT